jgi:hypothetical protein
MSKVPDSTVGLLFPHLKILLFDRRDKWGSVARGLRRFRLLSLLVAGSIPLILAFGVQIKYHQHEGAGCGAARQGRAMQNIRTSIL